MRFPLLVLFVLVMAACPQRPLSDAHKGQSVDCDDCHESRYVKVAKAELCLHCHKPIAQRIKEGRGYHAARAVVGQRCGNCHVEHRGPSISGWRKEEKEFRRDHEKDTGFPLDGKHTPADCRKCHPDKPTGQRTYLGAQTTCEGCHAAASPHGPLRDNTCKRCHAVTGWKPMAPQSRFDHTQDTQYPLEEKHKAVPCVACHKGTNFRLSIERYGDCAPCHQSKHGGTFGKEVCRTCHSAARNFKESLPFDHGRTRFALTGPHDKPCQKCHKPGSPSVPGLDCASAGCHKTPHGTRFNRQPQCTLCHVGSTWTQSVFEHGKRTRFSLTFNHVADTNKECRTCHRGKRPAAFEDLSGLMTQSGPSASFPVDCLGCHKHAKVHGKRFTSAQCLDCHETPGREKVKTCRGNGEARDAACIKKMIWVGHSPGSPFPLIGGHDLAVLPEKCQACHPNPAKGFTRVPSTCVSCHDKKDPHRRSLGKVCENCHDFRNNSWKDTARFNHQKTAFPLEGVHLKTPCERCHPTLPNPAMRFKPRPTLCGDAACHKKDDVHKNERSSNCGEVGCHDPRDGGWKIPLERRRIKP